MQDASGIGLGVAHKNAQAGAGHRGERLDESVQLAVGDPVDAAAPGKAVVLQGSRARQAGRTLPSCLRMPEPEALMEADGAATSKLHPICLRAATRREETTWPLENVPRSNSSSNRGSSREAQGRMEDSAAHPRTLGPMLGLLQPLGCRCGHMAGEMQLVPSAPASTRELSRWRDAGLVSQSQCCCRRLTGCSFCGFKGSLGPEPK